METRHIIYLVLIVICIFLSAFFSSAETAYLSLQKVRLEHLVKTRVKKAGLVAGMVERPEKLLSIVLLGNNLVNTAAAALVTALAMDLWGAGGIAYATIIITVVLLIFGETTPKTFAAQHSERLALLYIHPLNILSWIFTPVVAALSWFAAVLSRLFGGGEVARTLASPEEIRTMISVGSKEGSVEPKEARMLYKVFDFGDRPVHEVMVPRPEVVAVEKGATLAKFLDIYAENPHSRYPVYQDSIDNIVAVISVKDVMMALAKGSVIPESSIDELSRPPYFVPETKPIDELFAEMRDNNYRLAVIVDEYGGTAGIVTTTMLVEEIVGDVGDEIAGFDRDYEIINDYTFQVDGSMRIDEANEEMSLDLPEGEDYETIAGFILSLLGHIPHVNEQLRYDGLKMVITEMKGLKIEKVLIIRERQGVESEPHRAHQPQQEEKDKPEENHQSAS